MGKWKQNALVPYKPGDHTSLRSRPWASDLRSVSLGAYVYYGAHVYCHREAGRV